ncbi:MAG: type II secretion system F family protein [Verrucomicrobiota bacterium]
MQLRFQDKEHFFHDTAQMLRSGIPLQRAWEHLAAGRDRSAAAARTAAARVNSGLDAALDAGGFSLVDREIMAAGEQSGRLEEACREMADYYAHLTAGRNRAVAASLYPVFILHLAALLLSIPPAIIDGHLSGFFMQAALFLGTAYLIGGTFVLLFWVIARAFQSNPAADRLIRIVPVVGGFFRDAALARFCLVLSLGIRSADGVLSSLVRAGRASKSACLNEVAAAAVSAIRLGSGFADSLAASRTFPVDLERAFHVAEASGRLEAEITRWAGIYRDRYFKRIDALAEWLPRILYLLVVGMVVFRMFSLISQITGSLSSALEM